MSADDSPLRVTFLTHYFPPEVGAAQTRLFELAKRLVENGEVVTVVTPFPNYPDGVIPARYRGMRFMQEEMEGIRILRTWVYPAPNRGFLKRILNHLSFSVSSLLSLRKLGATDVIFVQSPPLFVGFAALIFTRVTRAPFVFHVSDIWPQSAVEMGALQNRLAIRLAEMLERHLYRRAARVTVPTPGMVERLRTRGVPREKVFLLTNGVDTTTYVSSHSDDELARRLGIAGYKVFLYAGTHGLAQGLDVVLEAAKLTNDPQILYVLAGEGADKAALMAKVDQEGIKNLRFLPNQPRSMMPSLLNLAYASIIPLRRLDLFKSALPSKMFESMAVGRPIIAALWGEGAALVKTAGCGLITEPEDPRSMHEAVKRLAADPKLAAAMGNKGRQYVVDRFDRKAIAQRLDELLRDTARQRAR